MPTDRYIIEFQTNYSAALAALDALAAKVAAVDAQLNALGARATTAGGTIVPPIPTGFGQNVANATQRLQQLQIAQQTAAGGAAGLTTASTATSAAIARLSARVEFAQAKFLAFGKGTIGQQQAASKLINAWTNLGAAQAAAGQSTAQATAAIARLAPIAGGASAQMSAVSAATGKATDSFVAHARRISETILVYGAFFSVLAGVKSLGDLTITIDRESRRLEAVTGILREQTPDFISGLADVAVETVTPLEDLTASADAMAAAFLDLPPGVERAAATLELANQVGQLTTITQRSVAEETSHVIAIMKQFNIPIEELGTNLGKLVVAGGNSSSLISELADALQVSAIAASTAGVEFDTLLAIESEFLIQTNRTGSSVGQTFKTLFERFKDPDVAKSVSDITNGLVSIRNASGEIRDPIQVFLELKALLKDGVISATQYSDAIDAIGPPLNPSAKADIALVLDLLDNIAPRVREISAATEDSLTGLVNEINDALGPRFLKFIEEAKRGFVELFGPDLIAAGQGILDIIISIRDFIGQLPPEVIKVVVEFLAFVAAFKTLAFVGGNLLKLLGIGGLTGSFIKLGGAAAVTGTKFTLFGKAVFTAGGLIGGLARQVIALLPLLAAFQAIDFVGKINEQQQALREGIGANIVGATLEDLKRQRDKIVSQLSDFQRERVERGISPTAPLGFDPIGAFRQSTDLKSFTTDPVLIEALKEVDKQIALLEAAGAGATVSQDNLSESFQSTGLDAEDYAKRVEELTTAYDNALISASQYAAGLKGITEQQKIAQEAEELQLGLVDEISKALEKLTDRYRDGKISAEEYAAGQDDVTRASELAAQLVAAAGEQLAQIPLLASAAADGNDKLTAAVFDLIVQSSDSLPVIDQLITKIVSIAAAAAGAAEIARRNPIVIRTIIAPPGSNLGGFPEGFDEFGDPIRSAHQINTGPSIGDIQNSIADQINQLLRGLLGTLTGGTSASFGTGPSGGGGGSRAQTPILDIGDLSRKDIAAIVSIATELRSKIPGAAQDSEGAIVSLIKDGKFLRTIRGIDDRLLRIAIQQLTDQMKTANDLAAEQLKKDALLRNLTVRTGPLGALISQPTTFGLGGSVAQGTGLNFDPSQGNFVINVPVELKGLEPAKLQQLIYNIISKAIRDAARL